MCSQDSNGCIERPNFFTGQLLSAEDLKAEQEYLRKKQKLHNRHLHGCGIVFGLEISITKDNRILINSGLALDTDGNEIVSCKPIEIEPLVNKSSLYIIITYKECETESVPVFSDELRNSSEETGSKRIKETFEITFEMQNHWNSYKSKKIPSFDLEELKGIPLGKIKFEGGRWRIARHFRRPLLK